MDIMKKMLFMAATAALALASCTSEDALNQAAQKPAEDGAVTFSAYTGRAVTRGAISDIITLQAEGGFGVYAYEQGNAGWTSYSASNSVPNFFYNQQVNTADPSGDPVVWTYEPIKYYSNNQGAKHSFFAYAPWSADVKTVFALGKAPSIRFTAGETTDLMYANAILDKPKASVKEKLVFNFQHGLSKVSFVIRPFVDEVHGSTSTNHPITNPLADGTTITLRSIKIVGKVPSQGLMSLADGTWVAESMEEGAYQAIPTSVITMDKNTTAYLPVASDMMVIPTQNSDKIKIEVVYDVETIDPNDARNNSIITNTIKSEEEFSLVKGTAYNFKLDLGMTSVKFDASVTNWSATQEEYVDLPNNTNYTTVAFAVISLANVLETAPSAAGTEGDVKFDKTGLKLYYYDGSGWVELSNECVKAEITSGTYTYYYYDTANSKYAEITETINDVSELKDKPDGYYLLQSTGVVYKVQN